jgi:hypothetical protein
MGRGRIDRSSSPGGDRHRLSARSGEYAVVTRITMACPEAIAGELLQRTRAWLHSKRLERTQLTSRADGTGQMVISLHFADAADAGRFRATFR